MTLTFGARLIALKAGITLIVCLVLCIFLFAGVQYSLYREIDSFLLGEVLELEAKLKEPAESLDSAERRIRIEIGARRRGDFSMRVLDTHGVVLISSSAVEYSNIRWQAPPRPTGNLLVRNEPPTNGQSVIRTCSKWVTRSDGTTLIAQTTYRLDDLHDTLRRFAQFCGLALLAATILSLLGGRIMSRLVLLPIGQMALSARKIGVESLNERLQRRGTGDELDQLAGTFNEMFERLETQVNQIRQFTADAAHELRTPLAALRGTAEVALSRPRSTEELRATIGDSIEEFDRLSRIANDLLLLARADAGQTVVRRIPMSLDRAIRDVADLYSPLAEEANIALSCEMDREVWIDGDDGRMRQMIGNILDNAIKYTPDGGRIAIELATSGDRAEMRVRDTGTGVSTEDLQRVFDRFFRADRARGRKGGTGLGLAISRTIVEAHGGTIRIESTPGQGSMVTVNVPACDKAQASDPPA